MFTREELIAYAYEKYGNPICTDKITEALKEPDIESAAQVLIDDSAYWDGTW